MVFVWGSVLQIQLININENIHINNLTYSANRQYRLILFYSIFFFVFLLISLKTFSISSNNSYLYCQWIHTILYNSEIIVEKTSKCVKTPTYSNTTFLSVFYSYKIISSSFRQLSFFAKIQFFMPGKIN